MAASYLSAWSPAAIVAAHTALLALLDTGATVGSITIHDSADVELAQIDLEDPAGAVNGTTGVLTLAPAAAGTATATGTASYATIRDADGDPHRSLTCQAGSSAVTDRCVLNTLSIVSGGPVEIVSAVIS
jgi:hypothetical protein